MATTTTAAALRDVLRPREAVGLRLGRLAKRKPLGAFALALCLVVVSAAIFAPVIAPYDPIEQYYDHVMVPPNPQFWFGTDNFGRDLLSRIIHGARISLQVGIVAVIIGIFGGSFIGIVSGFFEGKLDLGLQRWMDGWMAFPNIIFALAILAALGPGLTQVMIAIGFSAIPTTNRVVRGAVLREKRNVYVEAAQAIGCGKWRIMARHILPNVTAPIIIMATLELGTAILSEASLSFLGVGTPPPNPSWGAMLSGHHRTYMLAAPWMAIFPGIAISLAVLGWNLFGDALRDIWDPRLRGST